MNARISKQRSCVGCKKKDEKISFLRIIFNGKNLIIDNTKQDTDGRGCYLCANNECLKKAAKRNAFNYRLKQKISKEEVERFESEFNEKIK